MNFTVPKVSASSVLTTQTPHHLCWWNAESLVRSVAVSLSQLFPSQCFCIYPSVLSSLPVQGRISPFFTVIPSRSDTSALHDCNEWLPQGKPMFCRHKQCSCSGNNPFLQDPTATEAADALLAAYLGFIKDYRKTKSENKNN